MFHHLNRASLLPLRNLLCLRYAYLRNRYPWRRRRDCQKLHDPELEKQYHAGLKRVTHYRFQDS